MLPPLRFHNRLAVAFLRQQAVKLPISLEDPGILYAGMEPGAFESEAPINFLEHVDIVAQIQGNHMVIPSTPVNVSACQACVACCCCCCCYCHYCCKRVDSHGAGHHPPSCFDSFAHLLQAFLSAAQALQELTTGTNVNAALNFARRSVSLLKVSECVWHAVPPVTCCCGRTDTFVVHFGWWWRLGVRTLCQLVVYAPTPRRCLRANFAASCAYQHTQAIVMPP